MLAGPVQKNQPPPALGLLAVVLLSAAPPDEGGPESDRKRTKSGREADRRRPLVPTRARRLRRESEIMDEKDGGAWRAGVRLGRPLHIRGSASLSKSRSKDSRVDPDAEQAIYD